MRTYRILSFAVALCISLAPSCSPAHPNAHLEQAGEIPEPDAKIVYVDGMPKISLNGKIINPEFNQSGAHNEYKARAARHMDSLGIIINQLTLHPDE